MSERAWWRFPGARVLSVCFVCGGEEVFNPWVEVASSGGNNYGLNSRGGARVWIRKLGELMCLGFERVSCESCRCVCLLVCLFVASVIVVVLR